MMLYEMVLNLESELNSGPYIAGGGAGGAVAPARKTKCFFFSNIVFEFAGLFLVAILVRNLKKTD